MTINLVDVSVRRPPQFAAGDVAPPTHAAHVNHVRVWRERALRVLPHVAFVALGLWVWKSASGVVLDELFLPNPFAVISSLWEWIVSGHLWFHAQFSLLGMAIGFSLGSVAAFLTAVLLASLPPRLGRFGEVYIIVFNSIPNIALVPIFLVWFGFGLETKILMGFITVYFIVFIASYQALRNTDVRFIELARVLEANRWQTLFKFRLLAAVPFLASAVKLALPATALAVVTAEFIGSARGLGYLLIRAGNLLNMPDLFAGVIVVAALVQVLTLIASAIETRLLRWVPKEKK